MVSSPVWEAWIEIPLLCCRYFAHIRRLPYGRRGLKFVNQSINQTKKRRLPYGRRGLKYDNKFDVAVGNVSSPVWEAWIEINLAILVTLIVIGSSPVWEAWIEIPLQQRETHKHLVVSRMGGVD